jgi:hypothetical protein
MRIMGPRFAEGAPGAARAKVAASMAALGGMLVEGRKIT